MKRILLLGKGFVGAEFAKQLKAISAEFRQIGSSSDAIQDIKDYKPDYLINAAGYCGEKNIDDCEHYRQRTFDSNVVLPVKLAKICHQRFIPWLHVSTACCWSGNTTKRNSLIAWTEEDQPQIDLDTQIYAGSKLLAEQLIDHSLCTIARIRMPFTGEPNPRNLITKLIQYPMAMEGWNSMSYLPDTVGAMLKLLGFNYGTFHVTNPGYLSTHEMIGLIEKYIKPKRSWPIVSQDMLLNPSMVVQRSTCIVSSAKIAKLGIRLTPVRKAFIRACKDYARRAK